MSAGVSRTNLDRGQFTLNGEIGEGLARWFSRVYTYKHIHRIRILIFQCNAEAHVSVKLRNVSLWRINVLCLSKFSAIHKLTLRRLTETCDSPLLWYFMYRF